jgi:uncharacterized protein (DUF58 family)
MVPAFLAFSFFIIGLATRNATVMAMTVPFVVYMTAVLLMMHGKPSLIAERCLSIKSAKRGQPVLVRVTIRNTAARSVDLVLHDNLPSGLTLLHGQTSLSASLAAGAELMLEYTVTGIRGAYRFTALDATILAAIGSCHGKQSLAAPGEFLCRPLHTKVTALPVMPRKMLLYHGPLAARIAGTGSEFFGVREYRTGDSMHHLNWQAAARRPDELFITDFECQRITEIGIILDGRLTQNPVSNGMSLFEHSIEAAAALASAWLENGHRVGLVVVGAGLHWVFPGYGKRQAERILSDLSMVTEGDSAVFNHLDSIPVRILPAGSQVVLVSPLARADLQSLTALAGRGYSILIVSPDPVAYCAESLSDCPEAALGRRLAFLERRTTIMALENAGMAVIDWDVSQPLAGCLAIHSPRLKAHLRRRQR